MSDGPSDMAALHRDKAIKEAKERYPKMEIVERDWRKFYNWKDLQLGHLQLSIREVAVGKKMKKCDQCKGEGKEHVIYVHETRIVHVTEEVVWDCRKCYGVGLI